MPRRKRKSTIKTPFTNTENNQLNSNNLDNLILSNQEPILPNKVATKPPLNFQFHEPYLITENGQQKWALNLEDDYWTDSTQTIYQEIKQPSKFKLFFKWLIKQWKWLLTGLILWIINHYSPVYLAWINNSVGAVGYWVVRQIKTALEYQVKGISIFNWIFYTFLGLDLLKIIAGMLIDLPEYLHKKIEDNKVKQKELLLKRKIKEQNILQSKREMFLKQIDKDQEFTNQCRLRTYKQNKEDWLNYQVMKQVKGEGFELPNDKSLLKKMLIDHTREIYDSLRRKAPAESSSINQQKTTNTSNEYE